MRGIKPAKLVGIFQPFFCHKLAANFYSLVEQKSPEVPPVIWRMDPTCLHKNSVPLGPQYVSSYEYLR